MKMIFVYFFCSNDIFVEVKDNEVINSGGNSIIFFVKVSRRL